MILRVTRSVLARYGRPAMIFPAITGPMPGNASSSCSLALLISTSPLFLVELADPVLPVPDFAGGVVCPVTTITVMANASNHRLKFITGILQGRPARPDSPRRRNRHLRRNTSLARASDFR